MKILLYTRHDCPMCKAVKIWLKERKLSFEEKDIDILDNLVDLITNFPSIRTVPILVIDGKLLIGTDIIKWMENFESLH